MHKPPPQLRPAFTRLTMICMVQFCIFYFLQSTSSIDYVEAQLSRPFLFKARDMLGEHPPFDERLKIYTYDDTTADVLGTADLHIRDWATLLKAITDRKPKAVYIDALFTLPTGTQADLLWAQDTLRKVNIPIVTAAFVAPRQLKHRSPLPLGHSRYDALNLYGEKKNVLIHGLIPMGDYTNWQAYGPRDVLQPVLRNAGHALNAGHGKAQAIIRLQRRLIIPHFSLMGSDPLRVRDKNLVVGSTPVPLDKEGRMIVDYTSPRSYYRYSRRILGLVERARAGETLQSIAQGDTVLILPHMYTGGTDFTETPMGPMPGGFVNASLLNSKIRGDWIQPIKGNTAIIAAACALAGILISLSGPYLWLTLSIAILGWFAGAISLFSYAHIIPDVSTPLFAFCATVLSLVALRHHIREKMAFIMRVLKTENDELRSEIIQAGEISRVFNPDRPPRWDDIEIGAFHESLMVASGDWFAFESSPSMRYRHFIMCDITGHGVQAAIVVSACKTVLSMTTQNDPDQLEDPEFIKKYAQRLNKTLYQQGHGRHATTIAAITFDTKEQKIYHFCAGHPAPFYVKPKGEGDIKVAPLLSQNSPLGFFTTFEPDVLTSQYKNGDALIVFTDGAEFPRSIGAIKKAIQDSESFNLSLSAKRLCFYLRRRYSQTPEGNDDVSIVWFRFREEEEAEVKQVV